jgi:CO/xanthine dehydrogenase Mo-binding subunit
MSFSARAVLGYLFGLPPSKVRMIVPPVGGSFGSRAEAHQVAQASLLALKAHRPVKLALSREEFLMDGGSREPLITYVKDGVKKDGTLVARHVKIIVHSGAYCGLTAVVCRSATYGASATYRIPNFRVDSYTVATNEPPSVPFRGFGSTQVQWAIESQMDFLARKLEIDPTEIRRKNILREGEEDGCGMPVHSIGVEDCMDTVTEQVDWGMEPLRGEGSWKRGKGMAVANRMVTGGTTSIVLVKVHEDAAIEVRHSVVDQGQGCNTVLSQIAAEEFGTSVDRVRLVLLDTARTYYEFGTVGSRSTMNSGNALRLACQDAKRQLFELASGKLGVPAEGLDLKDGVVFVRGVPERAVKVSELFTPLGYLVKGGELIGRGVYTGPVASEDLDTGQSKRPVMGYSYGATATEVAVNTETGEVKVLRMADCFDMGQPINPKSCEGQIESGRTMSIGSALSEEVVVRQGKVVTPNFMDYKMPTALDGPYNDKLTTLLVPTHLHRDGPYGAKGFSEGVMVPQSPAIASAIYNAIGVRIKDIPITKEKVLEALKSQNAGL